MAVVGLVLAALSTATAMTTGADPELVPAPVEVPSALQGIPPFDRPRSLNLLPGFRVAVYAAGLGAPRQLAFSPGGVLFAANIWAGEILALPDRDGNGVISPDEPLVFAAGLWVPHSLFFDRSTLYVGAHDRVIRFEDEDGDLRPDGPGVTVASLPTFGDQITRTVVLGADGGLYVGVGSTTDAGLETDPRRGAVLRFERDGSGGRVFARGLRNPVGLLVHPISGELWATDVGVDHLGEDHPLEELDILRDGADYGWPYCYEDRRPDLLLYPAAAPSVCPRTEPPTATFPAHTTPLGLTDYGANQFPEAFRGRMFVALHGSSKRQVQAGYELVSVEFGPTGSAPRVEPFASGWLLDPNRSPREPDQNWGRPVQPVVGPDGALYLSDDTWGAVYRIWWAG